MTLVGCTKRVKDRKLAERAYFHLANLLLEEGEREVAKNYFAQGRRVVIEGGKYSDKYKAMSAEFAQERLQGTVIKIVPGKGYGFIRIVHPDASEVFLHISKFLSDIGIEEFEMLTGETVSFLLEKSEKGSPMAIRVKIVKG